MKKQKKSIQTRMPPIVVFPSEQTGEMSPGKDIDGDGKLTVLDYPIVTSTKTVFKEGKDDEPLDVFGKQQKPAEAK